METDFDKYNIEHWNSVLNKHSSIEETRKNFDAFLVVFPTAARYWKMYIEKEISSNNFQNVEKLFKKCLFNCLDVDLWKSYINYIKIIKKNSPSALKDINTAYEFVIKHVGMDVDSTSIWCDHITFLKNELNGLPKEERNKAIRSVYHLALVTPMSGVDQLWREYDSWEHINDKTLAKGMLAGLYQQHQNAKSCCLHRKRLKRPILPGMIARPPSGSSQARERDYLQLIHWNKLIDYEKTNPQKLALEQLEERVVFTYRQALMFLRYYPEMWDSYAHYIFARHTVEDAAKIYHKAIEALPGNIVICFLFAEFLEENKKFEESREVYENLSKTSKNPLVMVQFQRFSRRCESKEAARKIFVDAKKQKHCTYHIYYSTAMLEYYSNKEPKIAQKIMNLALDRFINSKEFILKYLSFIEPQIDANNMREIYERILTEIDEDLSPLIWEKYSEFENKHGGSLKVLKNLSKRQTKALNLPETKIWINTLNRFSYQNFMPCDKNNISAMEKVLHTKIPEIPVESNSIFKKERKSKIYTFKGVTKFYAPDLKYLVEIKPGIKFLPSKSLHNTKENKELPQPPLPSILRKLCQKLPHCRSTQGIFVSPFYVCEKLRGCDRRLFEDKNENLIQNGKEKINSNFENGPNEKKIK